MSIPILAVIPATLLSAILVDYMPYKNMETLSTRVAGIEEANKGLQANVKKTLQKHVLQFSIELCVPQRRAGQAQRADLTILC